MFLKERKSSHLVEILDLDALFDLYSAEVKGRYHWGEEIQEAEQFKKAELMFLSEEPLPRCWTDSNYRSN